MSAEPKPEKEETQEASETPKREEGGREPEEHKIRRWLWAAVGVIGVALLTAGANDIYKFTKSLITGDSDGIAPQPIHSRPPVTLTHQLRDPVPDFVGREEETRILLAALKDRRPAAIVGGGGVGKTQLAYFVGEKLRGEFEAHIEVDMRGLDATPTTPAQAMEQVVLTLAPETKIPDAPGVLAGLYRQMLTEQAVLVLADNAADSEQVRLLVPNPPSALLITSRQAIQLAEIERVDLRDLPPPVSVMLLRKILAGRELSDQELERLAAVCAHLPLALRVAGNYLAANPAVAVDDYISRIEAKRQQLRWGGRDVTAQLADSVESLERARAGLVAQWRDLAVFPASFDREAAEAVARFEGDELDTLVGRSLVIYDDDQERFRLHDLMRELAEDGWDEDAAHQVRQRHAAHYLAVAGRANDAYLEGGEGVLAGLRLFDQERVQIEAGQAWAARHAAAAAAAAELAQDYPLRAPYVLDLRLHPRDHVRWLEASAEAAHRLGNREREGMALGNLGVTYRQLGEPKRAIEYFEQHLAIARETGDRRDEGQTLGNMGYAYADLGEPRRAIEYYEQHLAIARETGDRRGEGQALASLGNAYADLGEPRRAIEYFEQVLAIAQETGDRRGEGQALGSLGIAYLQLGEPRRAIEYYEQDLATARETGDRRGEGQALGNLGSAYEYLGELKRAIEYYEQLLAIARETGDRRGEGIVLWNRALAFDELGRRQEAISGAKAALEIFEQIEAPNAEMVRRALEDWGTVP